ncbi:MAG: hypothetical protein ABTQ25_15190 [Nitrosomonas ureae]
MWYERTTPTELSADNSTWNGTGWPLTGGTTVRFTFLNNGMAGQRPTRWRITLDVTANAAAGGVSLPNLTYFVIDGASRYNWDIGNDEFNSALPVGTVVATQRIWADGLNTHLGDLAYFDISLQTGIQAVLTKVEFEQPDPAPNRWTRLLNTSEIV